MNKSFTMIMAATLLLVASPLATADETHPDCEAGQPGLTYTGPLAAPTEGRVCEGEHWDGQDPVYQDGARSDQPCASDVDPSRVHFSFCQSADAKEEESNVLQAKPVGVRVSSDGAQHYVALNIDQVGQAIVYTDGTLAAAYIEDGNILNAVAIVVSSAGVTRGHVSEDDCNQETYQQGAMENDRQKCGRDNTAITVVLP